LAVLAAAGSALAAPFTFNVGGGWEVTVATGNASIASTNAGTAVGSGFLNVNTSANFNQIDTTTGLPQPITFTFRQVNPDETTAPRIVIDAEALANNTGLNWVGFRHSIALSGAATFNTTLSNRSLTPFAGQTFSGFNRDVLAQGGGVVLNGATWTPGLGSGALVIDVNLAASPGPVIFSLKETPIVPTPGTAALIGLGGILTARRRRSR
jgi:hypothetical protein